MNCPDDRNTQRATVSRRAFLTVVLANTACGGGTSATLAVDDASQGQPPGPSRPDEGNAGPFASAPPVVLTTLNLIARAAGSVPWCIGHAFRPGDLPAGSTIDGVQCSVKSTWPDGSAKIAVLAGITRFETTNHALSLGLGVAPTGRALTSASLKATGLAARVGTDTYGEAVWEAADWDQPFQAWVSGPVMSSWIYRKPVGRDEHLTAWLEVRMWATGDVEILPWIENGYLMKAAPGGRPGRYSFSINGIERFGMTMPVYHHTRMPLISGSGLSHWLGEDRMVVPKHDRQYLYGTGLVQTYMRSLERQYPAMPAWNGVSAEFTPYLPFARTNSIHSTSMGQGGGHFSIGVQPAWEAVALLDDSELGQTQLLRESFRFGAHQVHYRDEATNRPLAFSAHATTTIGDDPLDNINETQGGGQRRTPAIVDGKGDSTNQWAASHQPAAPMLAYLTTGRWWYVEECQLIAGTNFLISGLMRDGAKGLVEPKWSQLRQCAWTLRNLFIAACVTPDDDPLKPEFDAAVDANVDYFHGRYVASGKANPFGLIENRRSSTGGDQAWQYDFWTATWGRCIAFRLGTNVAKRQAAREFFDWCSRSVVGRLGGTGPGEFLYRFATTSVLSYPNESSALWPGSQARSGYPDYEGGSGPWWADWGAFYEHRIVGEQGYTGAKVDGPLEGGNFGDTTGWWGMLFEALMACVSLGAPGATAALNRVRSAPNWDYWAKGKSGAFNDQLPTNGVDYTPLPVEVFTPFVPAAGERANVNLNAADDVDYDRLNPLTPDKAWWLGYGVSSSTTAFRSIISSYSGSTWAAEYGTAGALVSNGGGHGGQIGQMAYLFDFAQLRWKQVGAPRNLPADFSWAGYLNPPSAVRTESADRRDDAWHDYNHNGSMITLADHTYLQNAYISPSEGGGPQGSLLLPQSTWSQDPGVPNPDTGVAMVWAPHLLSLQDGTMSRASAAPFGDYGTFAYSNAISVKDTKRRRLWYFKHSSSTAWYHDLAGGPPFQRQSHVIQKRGGGTTDRFVSVYNATWLYVPEADAVIRFAVPNGGFPPQLDAPCSVQVYDLSSGVPVDLQRDDIPTYPLHHGGILVGAAWCPPLRRFYLYEGYGDEFCYVLTPSSLDFASCSWSWSRESFSGVPPVSRAAGTELGQQSLGAQGKFVWVAAYQCFAWHDGPTTAGVCVDGVERNGIVQLWRPPGRRL